MMPKELFVTGVRLLGVWELLRLVDCVLEAYDLQVGLHRSSLTSVGAMLTHVGGYAVVGLYLLGGAPQIVEFLYPTPRKVGEAKPDQGEADKEPGGPVSEERGPREG